MSKSPKVSVCIITFNHVDFIGKALDSVLMQQTSFQYEVVIGDDCSSDGTAEVIVDYQKCFPHRVKPLVRTRNVGMNGNLKGTLERCEGEYIALLEGDDYWIHPQKLQRQADYLDSNPGCALCHHKVTHVVWPHSEPIREYPPPRYRIERPSAGDLALVNYIQTCSVMFRRKWLPSLDERFLALKLGDWPLCVLLSQRGWIGYLDCNMAHYRVHAKNTWNSRQAAYKISAMEEMAWYLLEKTGDGSKDNWRNMILALSFKDLILAAKSFNLTRSFDRLNRFVIQCLRFRKPFWMLTDLWAYYRVHCHSE